LDVPPFFARANVDVLEEAGHGDIGHRDEEAEEPKQGDALVPERAEGPPELKDELHQELAQELRAKNESQLGNQEGEPQAETRALLAPYELVRARYRMPRGRALEEHGLAHEGAIAEQAHEERHHDDHERDGARDEERAKIWEESPPEAR